MLPPLLLSMRQLRQTLMTHMLHQQPPPPDAAHQLRELVPQCARAALDAHQIALLWGEWQLLLVEGDGRAEDADLWEQIRHAADAGLVAVLQRREWEGLQELFRHDLFPKLAGALLAPRAARMQACIEVTTRLRTLAARPIGRQHYWLLTQVAEMQYPRFGTSGWRARMGQDFTWGRATAVAQAIIEFVIESGWGHAPLAIGYDSRINADKVAQLVARVAVQNGLNVHLASRETPSPALISYITQVLGVGHNAGIINCTPSHNPVKDPAQQAYLGTEYHGIRYNMPYGAVAPSRATDTIGRRAMELLLEETVVPVDRPQGAVTLFDPIDAYITDAIAELSSRVSDANGVSGDALAQMQAYWGTDEAMVVIDEMHSASRGYLRGVCDRLGIRYTVLHGEKDPLLGELTYANPEPPHIARCMETVRALKSRYPRIIGVGFDTDSDRIGSVDEQGNYVMTNQLLPMLADYLLTNAYNGEPGMIIRNMVTTRLLDRVAGEHRAQILPPSDEQAIVQHAAAASYQVTLGEASMQSGFLTHVVPVGFKYIADVMMRELQEAIAAGETRPDRLQELFRQCLERLLIAGEESNGMTSRGHAPDKDGLWGALLTLQMCAVRGQTLGPLWQQLIARYGKLVSVRRDVEAPDVAKEALVNAYLDRYARMAAGETQPDPALANYTPVYCGGVRGELVEIILLDAQHRQCYLAIRASGTEPINRIYVECPEEDERDAILHAVGVELEGQIIAAIQAAPDVNTVVDLLEGVELPPRDGRDLPATYSERIITPATARIRALAGEQADATLEQADRELSERNPAKRLAAAVSSKQ